VADVHAYFRVSPIEQFRLGSMWKKKADVGTNGQNDDIVNVRHHVDPWKAETAQTMMNYSTLVGKVKSPATAVRPERTAKYFFYLFMYKQNKA
jgi:hypothetical protein